MKGLVFVLSLLMLSVQVYATSNAGLTAISNGINTSAADTGISSSGGLIDDILVDTIDVQKQGDLMEELQDAKNSLKLQSATSCDEFDKVLSDWINKHKDSFMSPSYYRGGPVMLEDSVQGIGANPSVAPAADYSKSASSAVAGASQSTNVLDHSSTNVQKAGIDEPDIVKNDGNYIYYVNNTKKLLYIIQGPYKGTALDLSAANVVKMIRLPASYNATDLLIDGNKLVLVSSRYLNGRYDYNSMFFDRNTRTNVVVFDVSNKEKVSVLRLFDFPGQLQDSRLSKGKLTIVSNLYFNRGPIYWAFDQKKGVDGVVSPSSIVPSGAEIVKKNNGNLDKHVYTPDCSSLNYILPDNMENFNPSVGLIHTIDIASDKNANTSIFYGNAGQIHVTDKSIYTVSSISLGSYNYSSCPANAKCIMPLIWRQQENFSLIHKYGLTSGRPIYQNSAVVKGDLLNQYSMDEDANGNFRILTRTWNPELATHLWTFDIGLNHTNQLLGIEPKEDFKASRFIGDKLYLVTFQQIDPLFVIDLAGKPKILGELKIPGFSQYLHPYSALKDGKQLLIGLGVDTSETGGRVTTNGLKLDLYEVDYKAVNKSNITIKQLFTKTIGGKGSYSEAIDNPRVFVWNDKTKQLFLPIIAQNETEKRVCNKDYYGQEYCYPQFTYTTTFAGMKSFRIDPANGITQLTSKDYKDQILAYLKSNNQYYGSDYNNYGLDQWQYTSLANRVGYIGDVVYFVNNAFIDFNSTKEGKLIKF